VLPALFTLTLFVSAALLFLVQPLLARMVLPLLGGTPAVWNTCMVFFQALLLAGYAYSHAAPNWLGDRRHALLHLGVLALPFVVLPLALPNGWEPGKVPPVLWLLGLLLVTAGLPFFVVATSGPLLQRWFAGTGHTSARDPYFLYAASNLGSMLALLSYPVWVERVFSLGNQSWLWTAGYGLLVLLTAACATALFLAPRREKEISSSPNAPSEFDLPGRLLSRRQRWVLLAFVPSSLTLSVTMHLTTDIAAIPLLWVMPLALYLLTFVLVFARRSLVPHWLLGRWMPLVVLLVVVVLLSEATQPLGIVVGLHLLGLFWVGMFCHGELARDRPPSGQLTEFYLWIAVGGVLGGLFNALLAPLLFWSLIEYPLVLVLACLLRPFQGKITLFELVLPLGLGLVTAALVLGAQAFGVPPGPISIAVMFAVPAIVCYTFTVHPVRFALGLGALLLAGGLYHGVHGQAEYRKRSFFGIHRVTVSPDGGYRELVHGNVTHGRQRLNPDERRVPLTYYHRSSPIGQLFKTFEDDSRLNRVGVVGLGAGSLACYGKAGQHWTFFEIDPTVEDIARTRFTFLADCPAELDVVLGDARLTLAQSKDRFDLLVLDAFSSDAIPVHLLTREALAIYCAHLSDGGLLAFHISNDYLDLKPVLAALAADAKQPLVCLAKEDYSAEDKLRGTSPSHWVVLASRPEDVKLLNGKGWYTVAPKPGIPVWTDDYCNLLGVFKWDVLLGTAEKD
jgi:spermidine synthase